MDSQHTNDTVPELLTIETVIPTTVQPPLHHDTPGTRTELEADTTTTPAPVTTWGVGAENLPSGDTLAIDSGISFDEVIAPTGEGHSRILPKILRRSNDSSCICRQCPGLPSLATKSALRKHKKRTHPSSVPQCPMCRARVPEQALTRHLRRVHGIKDDVVKTTPLAVSTPIHTDDEVKFLHSFHDTEDTTLSTPNETKSERVYCQEYDCGRGFSSKAYLESHVRYFHSKWTKRIAEEHEASSLSEGVVVRPAEPGSLETCCSPTSMTTSTHVEEREHSCAPRPTDESEGIGSMAENVTKRSEIAVESSPSIQGSANPQLKITPPAAGVLPLNCRICDAPPTFTTKPTVTTCGHLFCFGCIKQHVSSMSICPVCNGSLLLYCLFELDLRHVHGQPL